MKTYTLTAAFLCASGVLTAQDVKYDYDRHADFSKFKTYKWIRVDTSYQPNQLTEQNIMNAVDAELAAKGLTKASGDDADLYVAYQASIDKETQVNVWNDGGYGWGWGPGWGGGVGMSQATTQTLNVGTIVIDMYDPSKKQLVWRGSGTKTLNPSKNPDKNLKKLQKGITKIMKNFPPKVKS
jgi:hypothetical protein